MITVRPMQGEDVEPLSQAAKDDGHVVVGATHVVVKDGKLVGYVGANGIPMVGIWMDTKACTVLDSKRVMETYEASLRFHGVQSIIVPCMTSSPFFPYMEKAGHVKVCETTLFFKDIRKA